MFTLFLAPTLSRDAFRRATEAAGFSVVADPPLTDGRRDTVVDRDGAVALFASSTTAAVALVRMNDEAQALLRESLGAEVQTFAAFLATGSAASGRIAQLHFLHDLLFALPLCDQQEAQMGVATAIALLDGDDDVVADAAAESLALFASVTVADALERGAHRRPRFRHLAELVRASAQAAAEGSLHDTPTTDPSTLRQRIAEGVERQQWKRVLTATAALLGQPDHAADTAALTWRGLALEALDQPVLALGYLGAAEATIPHNPEHRNDDESALLPVITGALGRLRPRVDAMPVPEREQTAPDLRAWLDGVGGVYASTVRHGAANVLLDRVPSLTASLLFAAVSYHADLDRLRRLFELVPDSRTVLYRLGHALLEVGRPDDAGKVLRDALAATPTSDEARRIDACDPVSDSKLSEAIVEATFRGKHYAEAAALAAEHIARFPGTLGGWQFRADGLLFAGQLDEAVDAYAEAITAVGPGFDAPEDDSLRFVTDPRGAMHFNRSCALARLGRLDEAVDDLRRAVRRAPKWAEKAPEDDWLAPLFARPDYQGIVAGDPAALVLPEERDPAFVAGLVARAMHLDYAAGKPDEARQTAERAAMLARSLDHATLEAKALGLLGRLNLDEGDAEGALALLERAATLARRQDVSVGDRAEVVQSLGHAHRALGVWDEAARAYDEALALRRQAHGDHSYLVAKSHGDLAVLAQARGEPTAVMLGHLRDATIVIEAFLASPEASAAGREGARNEALVDLGTDRMNESRLLMAEGDLEGSARAATRSLDAFEDAIGHGDHVRTSLLERELARYASLADEAPSHQDAFAALHDRLEAILVPGPPAERTERRYWRRWRTLAADVLAGGTTGHEFARLMADALRNQLHPQLAALPIFRSFATEMAQRFGRYQSFVVMLPMALQTAEASGEILATLRDLEELCVSSLFVDDA